MFSLALIGWLAMSLVTDAGVRATRGSNSGDKRQRQGLFFGKLKKVPCRSVLDPREQNFVQMGATFTRVMTLVP